MDTTRGLRQLPAYFKKIGIAVIVLGVAPIVFVIATNMELPQRMRGLFSLLSEDAFILGMLFIALAKEKVEDEMIKDVRLKSMARAFIFAVGFVLVEPLFDLAFNHPVAELKVRQVVILMLLMYLFIFRNQKEKM